MAGGRAYDARVAVKFDAFSVGMRAAVGDLDQMDVDALIIKAEQLLGSDDALTRKINHFATQMQLVPFDAERQAELGRELSGFVDTLNVPEPPNHDRRDIYG